MSEIVLLSNFLYSHSWKPKRVIIKNNMVTTISHNGLYKSIELVEVIEEMTPPPYEEVHAAAILATNELLTNRHSDLEHHAHLYGTIADCIYMTI